MRLIPHRTSGFTILELIVTSGVLGIVLFSVGSAVTTSLSFFEFTTGYGLATETSRRVVEELENDLLSARVLEFGVDGNGQPTVTYLVPVDVGEDTNGNGILDPGEDTNGTGTLDFTDGDVSDPDGTTQWGAVEEDRPYLEMPGNMHRTILSFERLGTVSEAEVDEDLNRDGDLSDRFARGNLVRETTGGFRRELGAGQILVGETPDADLDGNGDPDPLFESLQLGPGKPTACTLHLSVFVNTTNGAQSIVHFRRTLTTQPLEGE